MRQQFIVNMFNKEPLLLLRYVIEGSIVEEDVRDSLNEKDYLTLMKDYDEIMKKYHRLLKNRSLTDQEWNNITSQMNKK